MFFYFSPQIIKKNIRKRIFFPFFSTFFIPTFALRNLVIGSSVSVNQVLIDFM